MAKKRQLLDHYDSSDWMVHSLMFHHGSRIVGRIAEPCAGSLAISSVLQQYSNISVITGDVDQTMKVDHYGDATCAPLWDAFGPISWTVTNPTFNSAFLVLKKALQRSQGGVAFLLRVTFVEPTNDRGFWLQENPPDRMIVLPRYSFSRDGSSDSATCAWFIWDKTFSPQAAHRAIIIDHQAESRVSNSLV